MGSSVGIFFIVAIAVVGLIVLIVTLSRAHARRERQRISALWAWAQSNGFRFSEGDPFDLPARFQGLVEIGRGHTQYAFEVLSRTDPVPAFIFRYHFATTETRTVSTTDAQGNTTTRTETYEQDHWRAYLIIELGGSFPDLVIRPEHWGDRIAGAIGFDDIDFESEAFSNRYFVKSKDRAFAYAVIHPQTMEWMLKREFSGQLERGCFVASMETSRNDAVARHEAWMSAAGFLNRVPPFVWEDFGKRMPVRLSETLPPAPLQPFDPATR